MACCLLATGDCLLPTTYYDAPGGTGGHGRYVLRTSPCSYYARTMHVLCTCYARTMHVLCTGGMAEFVFRAAALEMYGVALPPGEELQWKVGRNKDIRELCLEVCNVPCNALCNALCNAPCNAPCNATRTSGSSASRRGAYYSLLSYYGLLLTPHCLLPTAHCPLPTACCLLPTAY